MKLTEIGEQVLNAIQALSDVLPELQSVEAHAHRGCQRQ